MKCSFVTTLVAVLVPWASVTAQLTLDFEGDAAGSEPESLIFTSTKGGTTDNHVWQIQEASGAPSGKKVLAITQGEAIETVYPVALLRGREHSYQNVEVIVQFRILGGTVGQAAGLVVRAVDVDHSYIVRASALDNSIVLLKINREEHTRIGSGRATVSPNRWHTLKLVAKGAQIECFFNDSRVFSATDATYMLGKPGLASHADSVVQFDNFTVNTVAP